MEAAQIFVTWQQVTLAGIAVDAGYDKIDNKTMVMRQESKLAAVGARLRLISKEPVTRALKWFMVNYFSDKRTAKFAKEFGQEQAEKLAAAIEKGKLATNAKMLDLKSKSAEAAQLETQVDTLEQDVGELTDQVKMLKDQKEKLEKQAAEMEEKLASTELQLAKLQTVRDDEKKALRKAMLGNKNAQKQSKAGRHETAILALKAMIAPINVTRLLNGFKVWELAVIHLGAARLLLHKLSHSASQAMRFGFKKLDRAMQPENAVQCTLRIWLWNTTCHKAFISDNYVVSDGHAKWLQALKQRAQNKEDLRPEKEEARDKVSKLRSELEEHQLRLRELNSACRMGEAQCGNGKSSDGVGIVTIEQGLRRLEVLLKASPETDLPAPKVNLLQCQRLQSAKAQAECKITDAEYKHSIMPPKPRCAEPQVSSLRSLDIHPQRQNRPMYVGPSRSQRLRVTVFPNDGGKNARVKGCVITISSYVELVRLVPERMNLNWAVRDLYTIDGKLLSSKSQLETGMEIVISTGEPFVHRSSFLDKIKTAKSHRPGQIRPSTANNGDAARTQRLATDSGARQRANDLTPMGKYY